MRIAPVGQVNLDGVRVPHSALLPHAWGLTDINACLDYNRLTVLFGVIGGARRCLGLHGFTFIRINQGACIRSVVHEMVA